MRAGNWPRLLNQYVTDLSVRAKTESFAYGRFDCVHMLADWIKLCTGVDHLADYRGAYSSKDEADAMLAELDGDLLTALEKRLGPKLHPSQGMRGDAVYRSADGSCGFLFTSGARMRGLFLSEQGGLVLHRLQDIDYAFRV
jgi:hypothetical protein